MIESVAGSESQSTNQARLAIFSAQQNNESERRVAEKKAEQVNEVSSSTTSKRDSNPSYLGQNVDTTA